MAKVEKEHKGQKLPSPKREQEMEIETEEVGADLQIATTQLKHQCPRQQVGPRKKLKASKTSFDLIALTEGDMHDIGEMVHEVTTEALQ